jgi:ADP-ribose pyrophosphatase YjhB (NUDIX family)
VVGPVTLGVRTLVPDDAGRVLLVRHSYVGGWHLPGGGLERAESLQEAAIRELREETGIEASGPARLLGIYLRLRRRHSDHVAVFVVERWRGDPRVDGTEIAEAQFFRADDLPPDATAATCRRIAEWRGAPIAETW